MSKGEGNSGKGENVGNDENKNRSRYSVIDHTADIGLETRGTTIEEAFGNAAFGMFDILSDGSTIDVTTSLLLEVDGHDLEELLVNFLTELLYLYDVEGVLFREFLINISQRKNKLRDAGGEGGSGGDGTERGLLDTSETDRNENGENDEEEWKLTCEAKGEPFDIGKHKYPLEIKAVTYHMLKATMEPPYVRVIFDL